MNHGNFEYEVKYGNAIITSYKGEESELEIPEKFGKYVVYQISSGAFFENNKLEKVILPKTINIVEKEAFVSCNNLKTVVLHMMDKIENPFFDCKESIEVITDSPRLACRLEEFQRDDIFYIVCDKTVKYDVLSEDEKTCRILRAKLFKNQGIISLPDYIDGYKVIHIEPIFSNLSDKVKKHIKSIKLPKHLIKIPDYFLYAFYGTKLTNVEIGEDIKYIGKYGFAGLNINTACFEFKNLQKAGINAFAYSTLKSVKIFSENVELSTNMFYSSNIDTLVLNSINETNESSSVFQNLNCNELYLPKNMKKAFYNMFSYSKIQTLYGIENLTHLEEGAFRSAKIGNIDDINFKELKKIENYCFQYSNLSKAYINKNILLKAFLFRGSSLEKIEFEEDYKGTEIPISCFASLSNLETINIPDSVTKIEKNAFEASSLKEIDLNNVVEIGESAFFSCLLKKIIIGKNVQIFGPRCFEHCGLKEVIFDEDSKITELPDKLFSYCPIEIFKGPKTLTKIGTHVFRGSKFKSFDITNIKEIGIGSFFGSMIEELTINIDIPDFAFSQCINLKKVNIGPNVKKIGSRAFYSCDILELNIEEGLQNISDDAFMNNKNLKVAKLPNSLRFLGRNVFYGCSFKLLKFGENLEIIEPERLVSVNIEELVLPKYLTQIHSYGLLGIRNLKKLVIPEKVHYLGEKAIYGLYDLEEVYINGELTRISLHNFENCPALSTLYTNDKETIKKLKSRKKVEISEYKSL